MPSRKASTQARKQIQQQVIEQDDDYIDLQQGQLDLQQEYIEEQKEQTDASVYDFPGVDDNDVDNNNNLVNDTAITAAPQQQEQELYEIDDNYIPAGIRRSSNKQQGGNKRKTSSSKRTSKQQTSNLFGLDNNDNMFNTTTDYVDNNLLDTSINTLSNINTNIGNTLATGLSQDMDDKQLEGVFKAIKKARTEATRKKNQQYQSILIQAASHMETVLKNVVNRLVEDNNEKNNERYRLIAELANDIKTFNTNMVNHMNIINNTLMQVPNQINTLYNKLVKITKQEEISTQYHDLQQDIAEQTTQIVQKATTELMAMESKAVSSTSTSQMARLAALMQL